MIAIPLKALDSVEAKTSKLFGRAPYILLVSTNGGAAVLQNEFTSGRELAAELVRQGVKTLITNHLGKKSYDILSSYGVDILHNEKESSVLGALEAYSTGKLKSFEASMVQDEKFRNKENCEHGKQGGECCSKEKGGEHAHGNDGRCDGKNIQEGRKRCCQK